jgi:hypothetical protein
MFIEKDEERRQRPLVTAVRERWLRLMEDERQTEVVERTSSRGRWE